MILLPGLCCSLLILSSASGFAETDLPVVVIVREPVGASVEELTDRITRQYDGPIIPTVHVVPGGKLDVKGAWTLLPLFPKLLELHPNTSWVLLLRENTQVDFGRIVDVTRLFDPNKEWFIGHELADKDATIVHHFAFHQDPSTFKYPHLELGILVSRPVLQRVGAKLAGKNLPGDFSIDVQHELAMQFADGVNLTHSAAFCLGQAPYCATWIRPFEPCGDAVVLSELFFAVKTCAKYHRERVPVVQMTWAAQVDRITFFSDVEDENVPTVSLGVPNTENGHCSKTIAIISHLRIEESSAKWYVIVDDDTILGVTKLRKFLSCYDPDKPLLIGQKYGYASGHRYGYDYITGGGGMVLSRAAVLLISHGNSCRCPRPDAPDDMWLGSCAESLGINIIHFSGFHQARPNDYPLPLLHSQYVISFHKHWMLDPVQLYSQWFADDLTDDYTLDAATDDAVRLLKDASLFRSNPNRRTLPDEL